MGGVNDKDVTCDASISNVVESNKMRFCIEMHHLSHHNHKPNQQEGDESPVCMSCSCVRTSVVSHCVM
jgi:hypothetical protein